jgi:hypothetical protein
MRYKRSIQIFQIHTRVIIFVNFVEYDDKTKITLVSYGANYRYIQVQPEGVY